MTIAAEKETAPKQEQDKAPDESQQDKDAKEQEQQAEQEEIDPHRGTARTPSQHKGLDPEGERNNDDEAYDDDGVEKEKQDEG